MCHIYKKTKKRGFTLVETLVVIGIIVVLLGVAIPAVFAVQTNLKMKELDDTARQIFLVTQNRLTTMKATGELFQFRNELERDLKTQNLGVLGDRPQDYGDADEDWQSFYYLNSDQDAVDKYLISRSDILSSYLQKGKFMLELNPDTGDVYSVFYVEEGVITRSQVKDLSDRTRDVRKELTPKLGYYGGNPEGSAGVGIPSFKPVVTLVNKEDLYVNIECEGLQKVFSTQNKLLITVTVTDESYNPANPEMHSWSKELRGRTDFQVSAIGELSANLTLDSLRSGEGFFEITNGKLTPGDDIAVTVTMSYLGSKGELTEGVGTAQGNSLFGKREIAVAGDSKIDVGYVRHLNNLRGDKYFHPGDIDENIVITQTQPIDFDQANWEEDVLIPDGRKPNMASFEAIDNPKIFQGAMSATYQVTYEGGGNELRNFVFAGRESKPVGLFSTLKNGTLNSVRLVDSSIDGNYSNVGLLAGKTIDCTITDCRAYINPKDEDGRFFINDAFVKDHSIAAGSGSNIGGLLGNAVNTTIDRSFGAVPISGGSQAGSVVGLMQNGTIRNSYGSGNITIQGAGGGGLVGTLQGGTVINCYSSANVTAPKYGGGLVGNTMATSTFQNSVSYGRIEMGAGKYDIATSGPFVGYQTTGNTYSNCRYFAQNNYNNEYTGASKNYGIATSFISLTTTTPNAPETSFPYTQVLSESVFPFPLLNPGEGKASLPHYGNWPSELRLQTSLVYYEYYGKDAKGEDEYGYYAITSLTTESDDTGSEPTDPDDPDKSENLNSWEVNSLQDRVCIEDGYALMTIYDLKEYSYQLEDGKTVTLKAVNNPAYAAEKTSVKIASNMSVEFKKNAGTDKELIYRISNANVYQLPFGLQVVDRILPESFYTKLVVNGTSVDGTSVVENFTFFYCPDFAKNAINPDPEIKEVDYPPDPEGADKPVYVRSARQLNGLGRSYYYWSPANSSSVKRFYFTQETDIDFGKYTKTYCGKKYNLMDTSKDNEYRNRPIGRPGNQAGSQFRNTYDGLGNKIIDYCLETWPQDFSEGGIQRGFQYTGMFGEIRSATLKNMVMIASNPGAQGEESSGYVKSHYVPGSNPGTGALVGLSYVVGTGESGTDPDDTRAQILNCVVSGYDVSYTATREPQAPYTNRGYGVVGGMVGFNYGIMENCTATMKEVSFFQTESCHNASLSRNVGGLIGSMNDKASVTNCYASGTLVGDNGVGKLLYGGIAGGHQTQSDERDMVRTIKDSYSTCEWDQTKQVNAKSLSAIAPTSGNITMQNCVYLTDAVGAGITLTEAGGVTGKTRTELENFTGLSAFGKADAAHSFPWTGSSKTGYPYPAIAKDLVWNNDKKAYELGEYIHYGDWFGLNQGTPSALLVYYEQYKMKGTDKIEWKYSYLRPDGAFVSRLAKNEGTVLSSGYGVLVPDATKAPPTFTGVTGLTFGATPTGADKIATSYGQYSLLPFSESAMTLLNPGNRGYSDKISMFYKVTDSEGATDAKLDFYLNVKFAEALSSKADLGASSNPLHIRTLAQLKNMTQGEAPSGGNFLIAENIFAAGLSASLMNDNFTLNGGYASGGVRTEVEGYGPVGGKSCYVFGLTMPLFDTITAGSTIENLALLGVNIDQTGNQAALAMTNNGKINQCFAQGNVTAKGANSIAAGLVNTNNGSISKSYFNGTVKAELRASAIAATNTTSGNIVNAYAGGNMVARETAGFVYKNEGGISDSYSIAKVTDGMNAFGFTSTTATTTNCFWAKDTEASWNETLDPTLSKDGSTVKTLSGVANQKIGSGWNKAAVANTYPSTDACKGQSYPYYRISVLDHYGDWPIPMTVATGVPLIGFGYGKIDMGNATDYKAWSIDTGFTVTEVIQGSPAPSTSGYFLILPAENTPFYTIKVTDRVSVLRTVPMGGPIFGVNIDGYVANSMSPVFSGLKEIQLTNTADGTIITITVDGSKVTAKYGV